MQGKIARSVVKVREGSGLHDIAGQRKKKGRNGTRGESPRSDTACRVQIFVLNQEEAPGLI